MSIDFENVILTFEEKKILFFMRFRSNMPEENIGNSLRTLRDYRFIVPNLNKIDSMGQTCSDGTYHLTDTYRRYRIYLRRQRFHRYLTPITVSAATTAVLHILEQWWLPELLNWLQDLF